jgi:hypothetical protein
MSTIHLNLKMSSLKTRLSNKRVEYFQRLDAGARLDELKIIVCDIKELEGKIESIKEDISFLERKKQPL